MFIYKVTNKINNKIYIGKDSKNKKNYYGSGKLIKLAIKKYGKNNFTKEIIERCESPIQLNEREKYWISFYNSTNNNIGYNLTQGGDGFAHGNLNPVHRPEVKEKLIYHLKNNNGSNRQEVRDKIRKTLTGRKLTQEHKNNISRGGKGHYASKGPDNPKSKKFIIIFPNKHEEKIIGLRAFCKKHNLNPKLMRRTLRGVSENHKGFILKEFKTIRQ